MQYSPYPILYYNGDLTKHNILGLGSRQGQQQRSDKGGATLKTTTARTAAATADLSMMMYLFVSH
jgi:hypothetical protein